MLIKKIIFCKNSIEELILLISTDYISYRLVYWFLFKQENTFCALFSRYFFVKEQYADHFFSLK